MKMSTFCLVTLFMVTNGARTVNQIISYETISPESSVNSRSHKIRQFTLGRAFWLSRTSPAESVLRVKVGVV